MDAIWYNAELGACAARSWRHGLRQLDVVGASVVIGAMEKEQWPWAQELLQQLRQAWEGAVRGNSSGRRPRCGRTPSAVGRCLAACAGVQPAASCAAYALPASNPCHCTS